KMYCDLPRGLNLASSGWKYSGRGQWYVTSRQPLRPNVCGSGCQELDHFAALDLTSLVYSGGLDRCPPPQRLDSAPCSSPGFGVPWASPAGLVSHRLAGAGKWGNRYPGRKRFGENGGSRLD